MSDPAFGDEGDVAPQRAAARFGPFVLCYELASGGMGAVFLAKAEGPRGFEKLVALKRIHPHLARDPRFAAMFLDEARIAARIHHPNVCGVHEFGEVDGTYYLTMPYLVGEPLHRVLREAARSDLSSALQVERPWMAARMVVDACEGLHAAHELRDETGQLLEVVHRDVSPQNLFVGYDGSTRVLDFGVASARHRHYQTSTGEVKGKFAYLAPEQLEGHVADRRVDVWALGVVLWEGIAGRRLFARENMAASVRAVSHDRIPPLSDFVAIPPELQRVVDRALMRDRNARYATAREMGRDLLAALARHRVIGPADVGEWLEGLFPHGRVEGERLVEESRVLSLDEVSGIALTGGGATGTMTVRDAEVIDAERPILESDRRERARRHVKSSSGDRAHETIDARDETSHTRAKTGSDAKALGSIEGVARRRSDGVADPTEATPFVSPRTRRDRRVWIVGAIVVVASGLAGLVVMRTSAPTTTGTATPLARSSSNAWAPTTTRESEPREPIRSTAVTPSPEASRELGVGGGSNVMEVEGARDVDTEPVDAKDTERVDTANTERADIVDTELVDTEPVDTEPVDTEPARTDTTATGRAGRLQVATPGGWALVFRGRTRLGEAPGTFTLPSGNHEVGVQPFGEGPILRRRVVVPAGGTTRLSIPTR